MKVGCPVPRGGRVWVTQSPILVALSLRTSWQFPV